MATISGYDSSSLSVLFSSLNNNRTGNSTTNLLNINFNDYATIRNGSYYKLLKSYYSMDSSEEVNKIVNNNKDKDEDEDKKTDATTGSTSTSTSTSTSKDSADTLSKIESTVNELQASTDALLATDKNSLFATTKVTDKEGNVTEKLDTEKLYKAVNDFVADYNAVLDSTLASKSENISGATDRMIRITGYNKESLEKIGITIGEDSKLTVDEKVLKASDVEDVKKVFHSESGYAGQVSTQVSMIAYYAENEASKSNTYTNAGKYTNNYNTGTIYSEGI